jgi:hypothetical protein
VSYNARAVNIYNAANSTARFQNKNYFSLLQKRPSLPIRWRSVANVEVVGKDATTVGCIRRQAAIKIGSTNFGMEPILRSRVTTSTL